MPLFSVIIVTFNSQDYISACLDSVFSQTYSDFETIVVDNGSGDQTPAILEKYPEGLHRIENKTNEGAAYARNQGINIAAGKWVLFLDCDTVLDKDFLQNAAVIAGRIPPQAGIIQGKILGQNNKIFSCGTHLSWSRRFFDLGKGKPAGSLNNSRRIFGFCSACALCRQKMLKALKDEWGIFDKRFFFLAEDVDLSWRAGRKSWQAFYYPFLASRHQGDSSCCSRKKRQFLCFRNRLLMIGKNEGLGKYCLKISPLIFYDFPRFVFLFFTNGFFRRNLKKIFDFFPDDG